MLDMFGTKYELKLAIRSLVYSGDPILRENLVKGTQILHSKSFPTQVFNLKGTKYIRINADDIERMNEQELEDLLKFMLATDDFSGHEEEETGIIDEPELGDVLTDAANKYQDATGEDLRESNLVETDDFDNIVNTDEVPITFKNFGSKSKPKEEEKKEEEEAEEGDDMTKGAKETAKDTGMMERTAEEEAAKPEPISIKERMEVEQALEDVSTYKDSCHFNQGRSILSFDEVKDLNHLANQLLKAFKGSRSKEKTITPKKHMNSKALSTDNDRFYVNKKAPKGKHIVFNLVIDMSGSMSGSPIKNAVSLIYLFNKLAQMGYVSGHVIYSSTRTHHTIEMGKTSDAEVLSINRVTGSEGLAETVDAEVEILKHKNLICITDGDIVDRPIDKQFWRKHKIISTGVYVNEAVKDPLDYSGSLSKWFDHSLVRQNLEEMIQLLVKIGIRG